MNDTPLPAGVEGLPMLEMHRRLTPEEMDLLTPAAIAERADNAPAPSSPFELATLNRCLWQNGRTLHIRFMDGSDEWREQVRRIADEWTEYANLHFDWEQSHPTPDVRITFSGDGCASFVGVEAQVISPDQPTMWLSHRIFEDAALGGARKYILHEFGHAIGCVHEHSTPIAGIKWNKPVVYDYYWRLCGWDKATVDYNVFTVYAIGETNHSDRYDPNSIMVYAISKELTEDGFGVDWQGDLSPMDKEFIAKVYPRG